MTNHVGDNACLPSGLETPLNGNLLLRNGLALILTENNGEATIKIYQRWPELLGQPIYCCNPEVLKVKVRTWFSFPSAPSALPL